METLSQWINQLNALVWGPYMLVLIAGTGLFLTTRLAALPIRKLGYGFQMLWQGRSKQVGQDISPFNALMTSLSATIGTGNIAGVATAIYYGGPGALFWMWAIAVVGMATKYAEAVCAVHFRETDGQGNHVGGPMYYIKNGMGPKWMWLGAAFALFGTLAGFGIGNTVQSNSVADALHHTFNIERWHTGLALSVLAGLVLLGGVQRIAKVAGKLVPIMGISYVIGGLMVLALNAEQLGSAFQLIFTHAFSSTAAEGGFLGASLWMAIRWGVARGVFSNEAGLGSAPIAHAAANTDSAVRQGTIAMLGTFLDTIIICSITGLAIIVTGSWTSGENGAPLTSLAFSSALPGIGEYIVSIGLALFAFTTLLGWSFYSEKCAQYLFGDKIILPFRIAWIIAIFLGPIASLKFVWLLADTLNALMAIPNLIALLVLSPVVVKLSKEYFSKN